MRIRNIFLRKIISKLQCVLVGRGEARLERYRGIKNDIRRAPQERLYFCGIQIGRSVIIDGVKSYSFFQVPCVTYQESLQKDVLYLFGLAIFKRKRRRGAVGVCKIRGEMDCLTGDAYSSEYAHELNFRSIARKMNLVARKGQKTLFCDMSMLVTHDARSGIQRVVRNIFFSLVKQPPAGYEVLPIYLRDGEYRVAYSYLQQSGCNEAEGFDCKAIFLSGDVLLMLELHCGNFYKEFFASGRMQQLRAEGVKIFSVLHDLIAIGYPRFVNIPVAMFEGYMRSLHGLNGVIAVSQATAEDYKKWLTENGIKPHKDFLIDWFHLGADFTADDPARTVGIPEDAATVWEAMAKRPTLLQVSTIEPRKGYSQALNAFEKLWEASVDVNFIMVGKHGWKVDELISKIQNHRELGKRLFWLQSISDEYLEQVYSKADGVLFASEAEGFGLAVIEGAHYGKPLILRDIPVFREIAGDHATYFSGLDGQSLADCINRWLIKFRDGNAKSSAGIKPLTWAESAQTLISKLPL